MNVPIHENKTPLRENIRLIATSRLILWTIAQLFILINHVYLNLFFSTLQAEIILGLFLFSALLSFSKLKSNTLITESYVRSQLISDVILMSLLFHVTGASANPFVSLLLFPLTISAATLSTRFTLFLALLTMASYGSLFLIDMTTTEAGSDQGHDHHMHHEGHTSTANSVFSLHLIGMWFNFALSASLISFFIIRMQREIRIQQSKINEQREQLLRDEQLLGIATQAASAAHHMSTPLSTMAILVDDLKADTSNENLSQDLDVLAAQINNCTHVLNDLRHQANLSKQKDAVEDFIGQLIDEFKLLRPGIQLEQDICVNSTKDYAVSSDPSLRMAVLNILNNAADASPRKVSFEASIDQTRLNMIITDFGKHDDNKVSLILGAASQPLMSNKEHGMGIGLFLSHATINRHKGTIRVDASEDIGTRVHISLELSK